MRLLLAAILATVFAGAVEAQENPYTAAGRYAFLAGDYDIAKLYLEPRAEAGDAEAQYWVGVMYSHGRGYPPVCGQAIRWYERAAKQGHPEAAFSLGFMLYHGWGSRGDDCTILSDRARAAPWLKKAAELGVPRAQYLIGHMYRTGDGVPRNKSDAFKWLERAASTGLTEAQFDLGLLHTDAGNNSDAYFWFFLLTLKGYPGAWQNAEVLAAQMDTDEIYDAVRRARNWSPSEQ
jgi:TPR repeat protein